MPMKAEGAEKAAAEATTAETATERSIVVRDMVEPFSFEGQGKAVITGKFQAPPRMDALDEFVAIYTRMASCATSHEPPAPEGGEGGGGVEQAAVGSVPTAVAVNGPAVTPRAPRALPALMPLRARVRLSVRW